MKDNRIYGKIEDLDYNETNTFWNNQAQKELSNQSVLLGSADTDVNLRNEYEFSILLSQLPKDQNKLSILDIGCGNGRWANNLFQKISIYHGIDFSQNFINILQEQYKNFNNFKFFKMSVVDMDKSLLLDRYDLIIITGVCMYINDNDIINLTQIIKSFNSKYIYFQESISIINERLTLKTFYSKELQAYYNAIYRTCDEYKNIIKNYLNDYEIKDSNLLLDEKTGARKETNAQWWFLKRRG